MSAPEFCEWCGDELVILQDSPDELPSRQHVNVNKCVALCERCGGLRPEDERYEKREDDRCACPGGPL